MNGGRQIVIIFMNMSQTSFVFLDPFSNNTFTVIANMNFIVIPRNNLKTTIALNIIYLSIINQYIILPEHDIFHRQFVLPG